MTVTTGRPGWLAAVALATALGWAGMVAAQAPAETPTRPPAPPPAAAQAGDAASPRPAGDATVTPPTPTPGETPALAAPRVQEEAPVVPPPKAPADQVGARAFAVLETHCARCHQGGRLNRLAPAAGFGNVLRLDQLAIDPVLVNPGNPDASRLYTHMLRRLMPYDVLQEQAAGEEPSADELQAVRAWISQLPPAPGCRDRAPITVAAVSEALAAAAEKASWDAGRQRFVSIAHLYNDCHSEAQLYAWRQAVVRLFNSVSWRAEPIVLEAVDEARTILRVDLAALGWVPAHWERIMQSAANASGRYGDLPASVTGPFGSKVPVARADWLANLVLRAPLYYDLLGLPEIAPEILKILSIDADAQRRTGSALRLGVKTSQFSRSGRLIERFGASRGALWTTFDAIKRDGSRDPSESAVGGALPVHDTMLGMFTLPNGLPAYFAASPRQQRIDRLPADLHHRSLHTRGGIRVGSECMACHVNGPVTTTGEGAAASAVVAASEGDRTTVRAALVAAGIDPSFRLDGSEPVAALVRQFRRPVTLTRLAAELGVTPDALARLGNDATSGAGLLVRRLLQGSLPRAEVEVELPALLSALGVTVPPPATSVVLADEASPDGAPVLQVLSDKAAYKAGDALSLSIQSSVDCHLTVVSVDQRGRGTVIFPSDFEQNNLLAAGRTLKLPGEGAPYVFRLRERGREAIVAICSPNGGAIDGIRHDFERQRFTDLGDYSAFLGQAVAAEQAERKGQRTAAAPPPDPRRGRRPQRAEPAEQRAKPDQLVRAAITIEVK